MIRPRGAAEAKIVHRWPWMKLTGALWEVAERPKVTGSGFKVKT